jgi:hypothetical protein
MASGCNGFNSDMSNFAANADHAEAAAAADSMAAPLK